MQIGWTAPTDNGGSPLTLDYIVYTDNALAQGYFELVNSTEGQTKYTVTGLTANNNYFFKVRAFNEVGSSGLSAGEGFLAGTTPSEPRLLTIQQQNKFLI